MGIIEKDIIAIILVMAISLVLMPALASAECIPAGPEVADNNIDEDCNGFLGTTYGYSLRAGHPRVYVTQEILNNAISRMYGPTAIEPYSRWFNLIKQREDSNSDVDLMNLALIYRSTNDTAYRDRFITRLNVRISQAGNSPLEYPEYYAVDIMFDEISDEIKLAIIRGANANEHGFYWDAAHQSRIEPSEVSWGYHSHPGVSRALAFSGVFALTDIMSSPEVLNNQVTYGLFNVTNFIRIVSKELSPGGNFHDEENRISGDPTYNSALPGSFGGMYDNFGYETSEESHTIFVTWPFYMLTDEDKYLLNLHDRHRATFWQNLQLPFGATYYPTNQWCRRADTESHIQLRVWNTQTDWSSQPNPDTNAIIAYAYQDPKMQFYTNNGQYRELCGPPYRGLWLELLYRDEDLAESPPSDNPTAMYFNGPGIIGMRSDWTNNATFGALIAGEGVSRRYEDANSFQIGRKSNVFINGGARIRSNYDNGKMHWYHIHSLSKNTLKIFDPEESWDILLNGSVGPLHSGQRLVASDNMGGQMSEQGISMQEDCYFSESSCGDLPYPFPSYRNCPNNYPIGRDGECEVADIIKYEHVPDDYTYSVGDGTASYTKKIDFFEREFLFIRPDIFVIFDRVKSVDPSYKKAWTAHTVDEPIGMTAPDETAMGMKAYHNASQTIIINHENIAYVDTLLPKENRIVVRGGDTVIGQGQIRSGQAIPSTAFQELDIPRWLEIFAVGNDFVGSLTITGDASEGNGVSETVNFTDKMQEYLSSRPSAFSTSHIQDLTQHWEIDQWKGFMARLPTVNGNRNYVITGNNENTLFGSFESNNPWQYIIVRPLANSYYHWKKISQISSVDMDATITVSVPHYFDAVNANGKLYTFAPHTDYISDGYRKRTDLGQWTIEIESTVPMLLDNFLNVVSLKDPGVPKPATTLLKGAGVSGVLAGNYFAIFAEDRGTINSAEITLPISGEVEGLFLDLVPGIRYYYRITGGLLQLSSDDNGGESRISTSMGTLKVSFRADGTPLPEKEGDLNRDNYINLADLQIVVASFGKNTGETGYSAAADIAEPIGRVDLFDVMAVVRNWGAG